MQSFAKKTWFKSYKMFQKLSVTVLMFTIHVCLTLKRVKLYAIFLHLDSILAEIFEDFDLKTSMGKLLELVTKFFESLLKR